MCLNWIVYAVLIFAFFKEPRRTGLEELKRRETGLFEEDSKKKSLLAARKKEIVLVQGLDMADSSLSADDSTNEEDCDSLTSEGLSFNEELEEEREQKLCCSCFRHMTKSVVICMTLVFFKRIALESVVGASPIITKNRYGWSIEDVGVLQLANGIIVIPACFMAGYLSSKYEDRVMALCFLSVSLIGMAIMFDPTDLTGYQKNEQYNEFNVLSTGPVRYVAGSLIAFVGVEVCESFSASMMSKVIPSKMAKGTFNSGLLETLVGTGGRAMGDIFVTLMGYISIRDLLNLMILPGMGLVASSIIMILWNYDLLGV